MVYNLLPLSTFPYHRRPASGGRSPKRVPTSERSELGGTPRAKRDGVGRKNLFFLTVPIIRNPLALARAEGSAGTGCPRLEVQFAFIINLHRLNPFENMSQWTSHLITTTYFFNQFATSWTRTNRVHIFGGISLKNLNGFFVFCGVTIFLSCHSKSLSLLKYFLPNK